MKETLIKSRMNPSKGQNTLDTVRQFILDQVARKGRDLSLKTLSLAVGKNPAYIHQFIYRGSPRHLPEDVRHKLADHLGISEFNLRDGITTPPAVNTLIPYLDHPSQAEYLDGPWLVPQSFLERSLPKSTTLATSDGTLSHEIRLAVVGDNTADFGISSGDMIMLNMQDRSPLTAGYFALDAGDHIRVRHLEQVSPLDERIMVSGNGHGGYPRLGGIDDILGRVVFHAHLFTHRMIKNAPQPAGAHP